MGNIFNYSIHQSPASLSIWKQSKVPGPNKPVYLVPTLENPERKVNSLSFSKTRRCMRGSVVEVV